MPALAILMFVFITLGLIACKGSGPTEPTLPDNVFKITDIKNSVDIYYGALGWYIFVDYTAFASYSNYDDAEADVSGKIYFGDGSSDNLSGPKIKKGSGVWESDTVGLMYAAKGIYRVKVELTAHFKRGSVSSTFEKDFTIE